MKNLTSEELKKALDDHRLWLADDGGKRADLRDANLLCADLLYADLLYANLRGANLRGADLSGAKNFYLLPVQDPRGYMFTRASLTDLGWVISAGCRRFTIDQARSHWGESYSGERWIGDMYLHAIDWLEQRIADSEEKEKAE